MYETIIESRMTATGTDHTCSTVEIRLPPSCRNKHHNTEDKHEVHYCIPLTWFNKYMVISMDFGSLTWPFLLADCASFLLASMFRSWNLRISPPTKSSIENNGGWYLRERLGRTVINTRWLEFKASGYEKPAEVVLWIYCTQPVTRCWTLLQRGPFQINLITCDKY